MQLSILGPVLVDGRAPRGAKERALLARLLVAPGTPVPAEALIEAAWPPEACGDVTRSLHVRLAKLRALIGPDRIVREPAGYRLAAAPESVDAHRFAALAVETAHRSPSDALALCDEALALWRGEPFADLVLADDAATVEARRLHAIRDRLRRARAAALTALGRSDEAATELAALVAEDPLREELVAELMSARYASGRHSEALDAYRELAGRLADVGLRPGPQIRELEAKMLRHADELAAAPSRRDERRRPGDEHRRPRRRPRRRDRRLARAPDRHAGRARRRRQDDARRRGGPRAAATPCRTAPGSSSSPRCAPPARCCRPSPARWACAASAPATTTATATRSGSCASASTAPACSSSSTTPSTSSPSSAPSPARSPRPATA